MTLVQANRSRDGKTDIDSRGVPATAARKIWEQEFEWRVVRWASCPLGYLNGRHGRPGHCCLAHWPEALDHVYEVKSLVDGSRGILSQPYFFTGPKAAELTAWCEQHGLAWFSMGMGWHHPHTIALLIYKPEER